MRKIVLLAFPLLLTASCAHLQSAATTVCTDMAQLPPAVVATLDSQDPHSALGVLWADAKSGCANGIPISGVSVSWTAEVWGMIKAVAPAVLPWLIGLL